MTDRKTKLREEKQETLREYLSERGKLEYVFDNIEEIEKIEVRPKEGDGEIDYKEYQAANLRLQSLKTATDMRIRLLNKYLPDLKSVDIQGDIEHSGSLSITWQK